MSAMSTGPLTAGYSNRIAVHKHMKKKCEAKRDT